MNHPCQMSQPNGSILKPDPSGLDLRITSKSNHNLIRLFSAQSEHFEDLTSEKCEVGANTLRMNAMSLFTFS